MSRRRKWIYFVVGLSLYSAMYLSFRISDDIVHTQNKGQAKGPEVRATLGEWADLQAGMTNEIESPLFKKLWQARLLAPSILNFVFYPARMTEQSIRQIVK